MTTYTGDDGIVKVGANTVAAVDRWELTEQADTVDSTIMGQSARSFLPNKTQFQGSIDCHWDTSDTNGQEALTAGASVTLNLGPNGVGTTGDVHYDGTVLITEISIGVPQDGMVTRRFSFQGSGTLTKTTDP